MYTFCLIEKEGYGFGGQDLEVLGGIWRYLSHFGVLLFNFEVFKLIYSTVKESEIDLNRVFGDF